jgi:hypothetical protein
MAAFSKHFPSSLTQSPVDRLSMPEGLNCDCYSRFKLHFYYFTFLREGLELGTASRAWTV